MADATPAETAPTPDSTDATPEPETDWKAEAEKWRTQSQKQEQRAKSNAAAAKELEEFKRSTMDDKDKAVADARTEAEKAAAARFGGKLVDAEIRVAGGGRIFDTDALLALDRSQFLTDDGDADSEAIKAWVEEHSTSATETTEQPTPLTQVDIGQGVRADTPIGDDAAFTRMLTDIVK